MGAIANFRLLGLVGRWVVKGRTIANFWVLCGRDFGSALESSKKFLIFLGPNGKPAGSHAEDPSSIPHF